MTNEQAQRRVYMVLLWRAVCAQSFKVDASEEPAITAELDQLSTRLLKLLQNTVAGR